MMASFVSHYREGSNAITQAGIQITRISPKKENDLEIDLATDTENLLLEQAPKSQNRACESSA
jgi:hypothetical protein